MMKIATAIWISTALLHRAHPERSDFSVREIVQKAQELCGVYRPGLQIHASTHCVATKTPDPARFRMLTETERGRRRLFRKDDPFHPDRIHGSTHPDPANVPPQWRELLEWYEREYAPGQDKSRDSGKKIDAIASGGLPRAHSRVDSVFLQQSGDPFAGQKRASALEKLAAIRLLPISKADLTWIAEDPDLSLSE